MVVDEKEYEGKENVILEDLEDCQINIPFLVKCIYVRGMKRCKLFATGIRNACFIDGAVGASAEQPNEFFFASHQIRIHHSHFTNFYLVARSNPIIEHCDNLGFGDLTQTDFGKQEFNISKWKEAGLDVKNLFGQVQDFNWLKQDHSPNWREI